MKGEAKRRVNRDENKEKSSWRWVETDEWEPEKIQSLALSVSSDGQQSGDKRSRTLALGKGLGAPRAAMNHK